MPPAAPGGHVLVTWRQASPRFDELLVPVVEELGAQNCTVIYEKDSVVAKIPRGAGRLQFFAAVPYQPEVWRPEFRRCWPPWKAGLKSVCRRYELPAAAYQRLAIELVHGSQDFVGCRQLLQALRPAAVVTEYDRGARWSCLVLAAKSLGIPAFTLQHGVLDEQAIGYVPVLADKIFCWGESSREILTRAGVPAEKLAIGGCPRLDRRLSPSTAEGRVKLGLDPVKPVVMLATGPDAISDRVKLVELFAGCMKRLSSAAGIIRLHASEKLEEYGSLVQAHPSIKFFENSAATLDESLAASDVVVIYNSGIGSDALVKRRLTVVVDLPPAPLGHGRDLVENAQCPCVKTSDELVAAVRCLLFNEDMRQQHTRAAEFFVARFCASFGRESARRIADVVRETSARHERIAG
jgi:hypothetical protein